MGIQSKRCYVCKLQQTIENFYRNGTHYQSYCKNCNKRLSTISKRRRREGNPVWYLIDAAEKRARYWSDPVYRERALERSRVWKRRVYAGASEDRENVREAATCSGS